MAPQNLVAPKKLVATARETAAMLGDGLRKFKHRITKDPSFPRPISLSPHRSVWRVADVEAWIAARPPVDVAEEPEKLRLGREAARASKATRGEAALDAGDKHANAGAPACAA